MKTEQILINGLSGNEIIFREGKAPDIFVPRSLRLTGNIDTVSRYLEKQKGTIPILEGTMNANIEIDREKMTIKLYVDPKGQSFDSIWGKLELHEDFLKFEINTGEEFSTTALAELFKMNRSCFKDRDAAMKLVKELRTFKAKIDKEVEKTSDDRANYTLHKSQAVDSNIPDNFYLVIPIFKGQPKHTIQVEININADSLNCSLISPEANDYISDQKNQIIDEQIKKIRDIVPDLCILEQ
jgi:hypothetical protein